MWPVIAAVNDAKFHNDVGKLNPWARNSLSFIKDLFGSANSAKSLFIK